METFKESSEHVGPNKIFRKPPAFLAFSAIVTVKLQIVLKSSLGQNLYQ